MPCFNFFQAEHRLNLSFHNYSEYTEDADDGRVHSSSIQV